MKANVGSYDCGVRFILGCIILDMSIHGLGWWAALGLLPILSSALAYCPLYRLLHIDTAAWEEARERRHEHTHGH